MFLVSITSEKFEFYEVKMYLDAQKGIPHVASENCGFCITPNWFHHGFRIIILLIFDALWLLAFCLAVALMITDSQEYACKKTKQNEGRRNRDKIGRETWDFNFKPRNSCDLQTFYYLTLSINSLLQQKISPTCDVCEYQSIKQNW